MLRGPLRRERREAVENLQQQAQVHLVAALEAPREAPQVLLDLLARLRDLARGDAEAVDREDGVDEIVRLVNNHNAARQTDVETLPRGTLQQKVVRQRDELPAARQRR